MWCVRLQGRLDEIGSSRLDGLRYDNLFRNSSKSQDIQILLVRSLIRVDSSNHDCFPITIEESLEELCELRMAKGDNSGL